LLFTDIDECAPGGSAAACSASNGVCNGTMPPGSFTCTCNDGYKLNSKGTGCDGMIISITTATSDFSQLSQYMFIVIWKHVKDKVLMKYRFTGVIPEVMCIVLHISVDVLN